MNFMENTKENDQFQWCPKCEKETNQKLELYNLDDPENDLIWVCDECKEGISFH